MILLKWRASLGLARIESMDWHQTIQCDTKEPQDENVELN